MSIYSTKTKAGLTSILGKFSAIYKSRYSDGMNNSYMKRPNSNLVQNLKAQVKELRTDVKKKEEEVLKIKRTLKATNIQELEVEMKLYVDE